jgi:hypothetical protein
MQLLSAALPTAVALLDPAGHAAHDPAPAATLYVLAPQGKQPPSEAGWAALL